MTLFYVDQCKEAANRGGPETLPKRYLQTQLSLQRGAVFLGCTTTGAITHNPMNRAIVTAHKVIHMVFFLSVQRASGAFSTPRKAERGRRCSPALTRRLLFKADMTSASMPTCQEFRIIGEV